MTAAWLPRFACPDCREPVAAGETGAFTCARCRAGFGECGGVFRFLPRTRTRLVEAFEQQYRLVREREGFRTASPEYYRRLPSVASGDRHADVWRVRRESFAHLLDYISRVADGRSLSVLDLGAGCGWLSHRLAAAGHRAVAVDRLDDEVDGLGACRCYDAPLAAVQADFDALPFQPSQFDLVVFGGSLHYSPNPAATLVEANRMLTARGTLAVLDSPMFAHEGEGRAMLDDECRKMTAAHGVATPIRPGVGFLTFAALERATSRLGLRGVFVPSRGPFVWRARRRLAHVRLGRSPAAFGVWVAR